MAARSEAEEAIGTRAYPWASAIILGIVPVLLIGLTNLFIYLEGGYRDDPDYGPFVNALNVLTLHSPGIMEHPGTPVHIVGAVVLGIVWLLRAPFVGFAAPSADILAHPEQYLYAINLVVTLATAAATYYLGQRLLTATSSMVVALAAEVSVLWAFPFLVMLPHVTQEPLLIALTVFLMGMVVPAFFSAPRFHPRPSYAWSLGILLGVCIATKVIALPLLLLVGILRERRLRLTALLASVVGFIAGTLPAIRLYRRMFDYFIVLLTHTGHNGDGAAGVPSASVLAGNFASLLVPGFVVFGSLALCALALLFRAGSGARSDCDFRRLFLLGGSTIALQVLLVTKAPNFYYLGPACAVAALVNAGVAYLAILQHGRRRILALAGIGILGASVAAATVPQAYAYYTQYAANVRGTAPVLAQADASGCLVVSYYESPAIPYKLLFGTQNIHLYDRELAQLYPNFLSYNVWAHAFEDFSGRLTREAALLELQRAPCVYFLGSDAARFDEQGFISRRLLSLVARSNPPAGSYTALYAFHLPPNATWSDLLPDEK